LRGGFGYSKENKQKVLLLPDSPAFSKDILLKLRVQKFSFSGHWLKLDQDRERKVNSRRVILVQATHTKLNQVILMKVLVFSSFLLKL